MRNDLAVSIIRTIVPVVVGLLVAAAAQIGADIDSAALTAIIDALFIAAYYTAARLLERRWSKAGVLLGVPSPPTYQPR